MLCLGLVGLVGCALRVGDTFGPWKVWKVTTWQVAEVVSVENPSKLVQTLMMALAWAAEAVSLPYSFRHMTNCNLCVPEFVDETLFKRYLANWWVFRIFPSFQCSYVQIILKVEKLGNTNCESNIASWLCLKLRVQLLNSHKILSTFSKLGTPSIFEVNDFGSQLNWFALHQARLWTPFAFYRWL